MNLKNNYILSIKGHKKSNTGYYEEFNSDSSINAELLLQEDGSVKMIRRAETAKDYFATFDFSDILKDIKY